MDEDQISPSSDSEPDAAFGEASDVFGDFSRTILLMSLEAELRALVRKMNAAIAKLTLDHCDKRKGALPV